ncbi:MAG: hypothetical protein RIM99_08705 [Cyclobacteriaceae bacterium]
MHEIEPYYSWRNHYTSEDDPMSPFSGKEYNYETYSDTIYGYYIDPAWDFMGSETLYLKILFADYERGYVIMEFIGEWNDAINNDIMHLKRNIIEHLQFNGIDKFILLGEHVLNFHGSDDSYYEEWFEELDVGWIAMINFRDFVLAEMQQFNIDTYVNSGGNLEINNWRAMKPQLFCERVDGLIQRRISLT